MFETLSKLPIPVEGDVQIFDDPECTRYATGVKNEGDKFYVRINNPWGFDESWERGSGSTSNSFSAMGPTTEYPNEEYTMQVWIDGTPLERSANPYIQGQVVEIYLWSDLGDVTNYQKVFTKP